MQLRIYTVFAWHIFPGQSICHFFFFHFQFHHLNPIGLSRHNFILDLNTLRSDQPFERFSSIETDVLFSSSFQTSLCVTFAVYHFCQSKLDTVSMRFRFVQRKLLIGFRNAQLVVRSTWIATSIIRFVPLFVIIRQLSAESFHLRSETVAAMLLIDRRARQSARSHTITANWLTRRSSLSAPVAITVPSQVQSGSGVCISFRCSRPDEFALICQPFFLLSYRVRLEFLPIYSFMSTCCSFSKAVPFFFVWQT